MGGPGQGERRGRRRLSGGNGANGRFCVCNRAGAARGRSAGLASAAHHPGRSVRRRRAHRRAGACWRSATGELIGQQIVVENAVGAGGTTARPAREGRTRRPPGAARQYRHPRLQPDALQEAAHDAAGDFAPVGLVAGGPGCWSRATIFRQRCWNSWPTRRRTQEHAIWPAGVGSGTHITCVLLNMAMGTSIHVPYRGSGPAMQDLMAGRIDFLCDVISTASAADRGADRQADRDPGREPLGRARRCCDRGEQGLAELKVPRGTRCSFRRARPARSYAASLAASDAHDTPWVRERLEQLGLRVPPSHQRTPEFLANFIPRDREMGAADQNERCERGLMRARGGTRAVRSSPSCSLAPQATARRGPGLADAAHHLVVPFAAGGPVDVAARLIAPRVGESLGQQIVIENMAGAGGMTARTASPRRRPTGRSRSATPARMPTTSRSRSRSTIPRPSSRPSASCWKTPRCSSCARTFRRTRFPIRRAGEGERSEDAIRLGRRGLGHAHRLSPAQLPHGHQRHPRALSWAPGRRCRI